MGKNKRGTGLFIFLDFCSAFIAWSSFFLYRKTWIEGNELTFQLLSDKNYIYGVILIPIIWILTYIVFDTYRDIYRISRLNTLMKTFLISFFGVIFIFFALILDDVINSYHSFYKSVVFLFLVHFFLTSIVRMFYLTWASRRLKAGKVGFKTLIIGGNQKAEELYEEIVNFPKSMGYFFQGFIDANGAKPKTLAKHLPKLGNLENLSEIIREQEIEEVIIAIEEEEHDRLRDILTVLFGFDIIIKIIPDMYDIVLGKVKMTKIYDAVLIEIYPDLMPTWQLVIKRGIDIVVGFLMLLILFPLYFYIMIRVRFSSEGPIFYKQERIGKGGVPFQIFKFRSMYVDAEDAGPQLSNENDSRCTPWGYIMRKWRLDELPQAWNVLIGDMSLVGPRPERQYYIQKITEKAPHYQQLLKVRPGITSLGQVKFGYASNVEQMVQRLKFDILYIENMSLSLDFKILFYTILVLMKGQGK